MGRPRTIEVFEHGAIRVAEEAGDGELTPAEFDALVRFNDAHRGRYFDVGHRRLKAREYVGYLEVGRVSIEILPKADRGAAGSAQVWRAGLLEMLRVALGLRLHTPSTAAQQLGRRSLLDMLALAFLGELQALLHEGLARGYRRLEANGTTFRGRLLVSENIRHNLTRADRFFVGYQVYDHDIAINQLLSAAVDELCSCALSPATAGLARACRASLPAVTPVAVTSQMFDRWRPTRATARYEKALLLARIVLEHRGPQLRTGRSRVHALLFDMNLLWERYVAALFRRAARGALVVSSQEQRTFWRPSGRAASKVRPDIVVRERAGGEPGRVLVVVDTKWKVPGSGRPSDDDLKQMFVYNELLGAPRSVLLYPATQESLSLRASYHGRPHTCEQAYLGVVRGGSWSTTALGEQVERLLADAARAARLADGSDVRCAANLQARSVLEQDHPAGDLDQG